MIEKDGIPTSRCETGDRYDCLCSAGIKPEGQMTALFNTAAAAVVEYDKSLAEYKKGKTGTLYWRTRPSLDNDGPNRWTIYSRLVISDKPEIADQLDDGSFIWRE
jgi:hypothetical protein